MKNPFVATNAHNVTVGNLTANEATYKLYIEGVAE